MPMRTWSVFSQPYLFYQTPPTEPCCSFDNPQLTHQALFQPEGAGHLLPGLDAHDELEALKQRGLHVAVVQLEELRTQLRVRGSQPDAQLALYSLPDVDPQLLTL